MDLHGAIKPDRATNCDRDEGSRLRHGDRSGWYVDDKQAEGIILRKTRKIRGARCGADKASTCGINQPQGHHGDV